MALWLHLKILSSIPGLVQNKSSFGLLIFKNVCILCLYFHWLWILERKKDCNLVILPSKLQQLFHQAHGEVVFIGFYSLLFSAYSLSIHVTKEEWTLYSASWCNLAHWPWDRLCLLDSLSIWSSANGTLKVLLADSLHVTKSTWILLVSGTIWNWCCLRKINTICQNFKNMFDWRKA